MDEVGQPRDNSLYRQQLIDAYLQRAGSFRKLFVSLLGFTAVFAFFIAWPYLATVRQEHALSAELTAVSARMATLASQQAQYAAPDRHIRALRNKIQQGPELLRSYILALRTDAPFPYPPVDPACQSLVDPSPGWTSRIGLQLPPASTQNLPAQMQQLPGPAVQSLPPGGAPQFQAVTDSCALDDPHERAVCRIDRFVQYQLCEYQQAFTGQVLPALADLSDEGKALFDPTELEAQFAQVASALRQHIADQPTFWHTVAGKGQMSVQLQAEVDRLWRDIAVRIDPIVERLAEHAKTTKERQASLQAAATQLQGQREHLQQRLEQIESPMGNLPVGLTESVLLFPVLLAIGFGMACAGLLEQLRLRRRLLAAEADAQPAAGTLTSRQLAEVAPLWIEPTSSAGHRLLRWSLLGIPLLVFLATVASIVATPYGPSLLQQAVVDAWAYRLLYAAGLLAFGICLWLLRRALARLG